MSILHGSLFFPYLCGWRGVCEGEGEGNGRGEDAEEDVASIHDGNSRLQHTRARRICAREGIFLVEMLQSGYTRVDAQDIAVWEQCPDELH